jgi:hypothetical protein
MQNEILEKVIGKWKKEELEIVTPYSEAQVRDAFDKIGKSITKDIIQIYTSVGAVSNEDTDSNLLCFWDLDYLVKENLTYKSNFALFGDFLINSHFYGYKYENENISSVYSDFETGEYLKITESVEEFLHLYLTEPIEIGLYKE